MAIQFQERTAGHEPQAHFSQDVCEIDRTYVLYDDRTSAIYPPPEILWNKIIEVIGTVSADGSGALQRSPGMVDPIYHSLFAEDVFVKVPSGELYAATSSLPVGLAIPNIVGHAGYQGYEFTIKFRNRPYPILPDSRMRRQEVRFYWIDGTQRSMYYYKEWLRHAYFTLGDRPSFITATVGTQMKFRAPGSPAGLGIDNTPYTGLPDMMLPDVDVFFHWYQVPQRYLESKNSFLVRFKNFINQRKFLNWPAGSLLYVGPKVTKVYTPPVFLGPDLPFDADPALIGSFFGDKLVDITLHFIKTSRTTIYPVGDPTNPNWLAAGHNLMPHFLTRSFNYASADLPGKAPPDPTKQFPTYFSIPYELLFQDPDNSSVIVPLPTEFLPD